METIMIIGMIAIVFMLYWIFAVLARIADNLQGIRETLQNRMKLR